MESDRSKAIVSCQQEGGLPTEGNGQDRTALPAGSHEVSSFSDPQEHAKSPSCDITPGLSGSGRKSQEQTLKMVALIFFFFN